MANPRVIVCFNPKTSQWSWGFEGSGIPIVRLIGYIGNVQGWLLYREPEACADVALAIEWDATTKVMSYKVAKDLPLDELAGTLELMKAQLVDSQLMMMAQQAQKGLVLPDGSPAPKLIR